MTEAASGAKRDEPLPRLGSSGRAQRLTDGPRPIDLVHRPLFEPIADWLARCTAAHGLPSCDTLNRWAADAAASSGSVSRAMPRFVAPDSARIGYEERVEACSEIVTRPDNWHDLFNALVWLTFPQSKAALNAAHLRHIGQQHASIGRGPVRDALTQFDESGIVVASADATLIDLMSERRWKELFWERRLDVIANMRFLVFGHGLYDALRAPFYRICGRAAVFFVERARIEEDVASLCAVIDPLLAERIAADHYPRPRALLALPLLGIPGVTEDNASAAYYDDARQFRPLPAWA